jgi:hypothetical protein
LHKYLYTHADPTNGIDPSGEFVISVCMGLVIQSYLTRGKTSVDLGTKGFVLKSATVFFAIAESLLWLHLGFSYSNSGWRQAQTGLGGTDVTRCLNAVQDKFTKKWNEYDRLKKEKIYASLTTVNAMKFINAWDIYEFAHEKNIFDASGTDICKETVTIDGKVYLAEEVNYFLWGLVSSLANSDGLSNSRTLDETVTKAVLYRRMYVQKAGTGHIEGRVAWIKAGWDAGKTGRIDYPTEVALPNAIPNQSIYSDNITIKLGIKDGLSIIDNISGGMDSYYIYFTTNASQENNAN